MGTSLSLGKSLETLLPHRNNMDTSLSGGITLETSISRLNSMVTSLPGGIRMGTSLLHRNAMQHGNIIITWEQHENIIGFGDVTWKTPQNSSH